MLPRPAAGVSLLYRLDASVFRNQCWKVAIPFPRGRPVRGNIITGAAAATPTMTTSFNMAVHVHSESMPSLLRLISGDTVVYFKLSLTRQSSIAILGRKTNATSIRMLSSGLASVNTQILFTIPGTTSMTTGKSICRCWETGGMGSFSSRKNCYCHKICKKKATPLRDGDMSLGSNVH